MDMTTRLWMAAALVLGGASALACSGNGSSQSESTHSNTPGASEGNEDPSGSTDQRLTDAEIASVTNAANTGEIAQANAALPKLTNTEAMQFAKMMVEGHSAAQQRQAAMLQEKGLSPQAHPLSTELAQDSDEILEELSTADRDEIDQLYMEKQVEVHQKVLETLDEKLIPSATDPALQQELQASRAEVAMHLQRAREILNKLE
jgi:putative membrane protein